MGERGVVARREGGLGEVVVVDGGEGARVAHKYECRRTTKRRIDIFGRVETMLGGLPFCPHVR